MILLDTHALVFYVGEPELLSKQARRRIDREIEAGSVWISSITAWEVAMLVRKKRLDLSIPVEDRVARAESIPGISSIPIDTAIALRAVALPAEYPSDPADGILSATAPLHGADPVTEDRRLRGISGLPTVW